MSSVSTRAIAFRRAALRDLFSLATGRPDLVRLEIGEPSFTTPEVIIEWTAKHAHTATHYPPSGGRESLRRLIAEKLARVNGYDVSPSDVAVTAGAATGIYAILQVLLDSGDEILIPTPGYPNLHESVRMCGASPRFYELHMENDFRPNMNTLEGLITPKTKAILVISPSNPTGAILSSDDVKQLLELVNRHDIWLISDEVYDELILDSEIDHVSPGRLDDKGHVISVYSFSKSYAMTGWRVGYVVGPRSVIDALVKLELHGTYPSAISQLGAEAALRFASGSVASMRDVYRSRRDRAVSLANELGLRAYRARGAIYLFVRIPGTMTSSVRYAGRLLESRGVVVAPGLDFGPAGEGHVRLSLAADDSSIESGLRSIADMPVDGEEQ